MLVMFFINLFFRHYFQLESKLIVFVGHQITLWVTAVWRDGMFDNMLTQYYQCFGNNFHNYINLKMFHSEFADIITDYHMCSDAYCRIKLMSNILKVVLGEYTLQFDLVLTYSSI